MDETERLFCANQPPKPISQMADWLDTPEGKDWFLNPIVGWDADGNPIRSPLDCSQITAGKLDASALMALCLLCGSGPCTCSTARRLGEGPVPLTFRQKLRHFLYG